MPKKFLKLFVEITIFGALVFNARDAHAYVDPGIFAVLFQYIYIIIFGLLAALVLKPYAFIKQVFHKIKNLFKSH